MAIKISREEFNKRFGEQSMTKNPESGPGFFDRTKQAASAGVQQFKAGASQIGKGSGNPLDFISGVGKVGAGAIGTVFSPVTAAAEPIIKPTIGKAVNYAADKLSDISAVQKFANSKVGQATARAAEDIQNYSTIAGTVGGFKGAPKIANTAVKSTGQAINKTIQPIKNVAGDVVPSLDRIVNHQVTRALDLTAGDVKNIALSTGNEVGQFLGKKNLIGVNKQATINNIDTFFKQNFKTVRDEISQVGTQYKPSQIPKYTDALTAIQGKVKRVPGLEKVAVEVENLLNKKGNITLSNVQKVKELLDDHFNLYKATGDVGESVAKQGLDNIRKNIKSFIEKEVKRERGTDISKLNNEVATAKGVLMAIEERATAGLTRSNIKLGDFGTFGVGSMFGGPVAGVAAVFVKKLAESPAVALRVAKYLDKISDARKARIQAQLKTGKIPDDLEQFVKKSSLEKLKDRYKNSPMSDQGGFVKNPFYKDPKTVQAQETFQRLQQQKNKLLSQGLSESSPQVKNIIKSMERLNAR